MAFIQLLDGSRFDLLAPEPHMFKIEHVAHALSMLNRFCGHTLRPYSVAEHSVHCAEVVRLLGGTRMEQLESLLHDRAEAYIGDITSPLKEWLGERIETAEARIEYVSAEAFGIPTIMAPVVKKADRIMLWNERRDLLRTPSFDWRVGGETGPVIDLEFVRPWWYWRDCFLGAFTRLSQ